jgi:hypothetical protein
LRHGDTSGVLGHHLIGHGDATRVSGHHLGLLHHSAKGRHEIEVPIRRLIRLLWLLRLLLRQRRAVGETQRRGSHLSHGLIHALRPIALLRLLLPESLAHGLDPHAHSTKTLLFFFAHGLLKSE